MLNMLLEKNNRYMEARQRWLEEPFALCLYAPPAVALAALGQSKYDATWAEINRRRMAGDPIFPGR